MFCPKCGTQNPDNAAFCSKCGNNLRAGAAPNMGPGPQPQMNMRPAPGVSQGTGLQKNVAALLSYIFGWLSGLIFYFVETDRFVRLHAMQSILISVPLTVIYLILALIPISIYSWGLLTVFAIIRWIFFLGWLVLAVIALLKAYANQWYKLPIVGDMAEKLVK